MKKYIITLTLGLLLAFSYQGYTQIATSCIPNTTHPWCLSGTGVKLADGQSQVLFPNGTAALPGMAFASEPETGIRRAGVRVLELIVGASDTKAASVSLNGTSSTWGFNLESGMHLGWTSSDNPSIAADLFLLRDAAATLALRDGTTEQTLHVYGTFTDASNYERGFLRWTGDTFEVGTQGAGTGSLRNVKIIGNAITNLPQLQVGLVFGADNTQDIGQLSALQPRIGYFGTGLQVEEVSADPTAAALTSGADAKDQTRWYMKNDKIVFAYNNSGTVTYVTLALDGSATTWVHSTTAP